MPANPMSGAELDERLALLRRDDWFASCPPALQQVLAALGRPLRLAAGEVLFARGSGSDGLCCVMSGLLHVGTVAADGKATLLATLEPCQWFGEIALIDGQPRNHDAVADGGALLLVLPSAPLQQWLDQHPLHWRDLARLACRKLRTGFMVLEDQTRLPLEGRLARRLWLAAQGYGARAGEPRRRLQLSQERLAQMLGVSRQSVNKTLRTLESRGWLSQRYGVIELLDLAALRGADGGS